MSQQRVTGMIPDNWWERLKGAQFGFIGGLIIGLIFGWFFHGVISFAIQFGMIILVLLPLVVIGWFWFRSQRSSQQPPRQPGTETSWTAVIDVERTPPRQSTPIPTAPNFVDVPLVKPTTESKPDDIEAQLEALKQKQERGS